MKLFIFRSFQILRKTSRKSTISFLQQLIVIISVLCLTKVLEAKSDSRQLMKDYFDADNRQALNYLLFSSSSRQHEPKLERLLVDTNHSHVSDAIDLQLANSVWKKMRQNALEFAHQKADLARPTINALLEQANISMACRQSINGTIEELANLNQWAVQSK